MKRQPVRTDEIGREFFESDTGATLYLEQEGFTRVEDDRLTRWGWTNSLVDADIRFNSEGTYIQYRA